ncbi:hypothetical protein TruAng_002279 [Truncatella angustata]|nr:hypothetical protein TruAng_002279 [Truncatella angustata]
MCSLSSSHNKPELTSLVHLLTARIVAMTKQSLRQLPSRAPSLVMSQDNLATPDAIAPGQGSNQRPLAALCGDDSIDIIILSFVHLFPAQANGYPGLNFGNQCSGEKYRGPGYNGINDPSKDALLKCPSIQRDLNFCRYATPQKKILLSLGGGTDAYQLTGASDGVNLATQLWYMFGPRNQTMVDAGIPRPFDYRGGGFIVDGFDLDIEHPPVDGGAGYIALSKTLQSFFKQALPVKYYLTASPQCVIPDANMKDIIAAIPFDLLFIQFYNTYTCSAKRWARLNPSYTSGGSFANAGFTIFQWTSYLAATTSKDAKIFLGLTTVGTTPDYTLTIQETANIANAYSCNSSFAGVSIWEAESAFNRTSGFRNYFQNLKPALIQAVLGAKECVG